MNTLNLKAFILLTIVACVLGDTHVTPVQQCEGENIEDLPDRIQVSPCGKTRCKLVKGTNATVVFKFKPKKEVVHLENEVYAVIGGLPLPFVGVTGSDACPQVARADTREPARCPLQPGHEYVYSNTISIETFYPAVPLKVHWSLNDGPEKVICFEVPAAITAAKN